MAPLSPEIGNNFKKNFKEDFLKVALKSVKVRTYQNFIFCKSLLFMLRKKYQDETNPKTIVFHKEKKSYKFKKQN